MDINSSLEKILESGDRFGSLFYRVFFDGNPNAKKYFKSTDMARQSLVLTMSLKLIGEYHAKGYPAIRHYLQHVGTRHSDIGVPRDMYPVWSDALLTSLKQFHGKDWNDALAKDWKDAVSGAAKAMFDGYDRRVSF